MGIILNGSNYLWVSPWWRSCVTESKCNSWDWGSGVTKNWTQSVLHIPLKGSMQQTYQVLDSLNSGSLLFLWAQVLTNLCASVTFTNSHQPAKSQDPLECLTHFRMSGSGMLHWELPIGNPIFKIKTMSYGVIFSGFTQTWVDPMQLIM